MSSSKVIRGAASFGSFHATLSQIERVDLEELRRQEQENDVERLRAVAYDEGQARGYRDGFDEGNKRGHDEGHEAGFAQGKAEFEAEHAGVLENLQTSLIALLADFQKARDDWFVEAEKRHAELAYEVARRALSSELSIGRESVLAIAKEVLSEVRAGAEVKVRVNPSDVSVLEGYRADLLKTLTGIRDLEVLPDRTVGAGVIVESNDGLIDARVESYLERIVQGHLREAA
ncbi:MAG: FliH/SctL family protein [Armatimonadota bacterium]